MEALQLLRDPYNVIITGVGGQGNVMASRILANMLAHKGYYVTIGETFGASQRGGAVMSHVRVSTKSAWSPQIPSGKADVVVGLEPVEAVRVLKMYGNAEVKVLTNMRPIYPTGVIAGELDYPSLERLQELVKGLSRDAWFIHATEAALQLGNPIYSNIIMIGAMSAIGDLPLHFKDFEAVILETLPETKLEVNRKAFDMGMQLMRPKRGKS